MAVELHGGDALLAQFEDMKRLQARLDRVTMAAARRMETAIKGKASGRPGPNAPTGDYRRSWTTVRGVGPTGAAVAVVGTLKPQGMRLEYGFVGTDALGRVYNQPPYPHMRPGFLAVRPWFLAEVHRVTTPKKPKGAT